MPTTNQKSNPIKNTPAVDGDCIIGSGNVPWVTFLSHKEWTVFAMSKLQIDADELDTMLHEFVAHIDS